VVSAILVFLCAVVTCSCSAIGNFRYQDGAKTEIRNDSHVPVVVSLCTDSHCREEVPESRFNLAPGDSNMVNVAFDLSEMFSVRASGPVRCLAVAEHLSNVHPTVLVSQSVDCG
jgi:hypothetical protein